MIRSKRMHKAVAGVIIVILDLVCEEKNGAIGTIEVVNQLYEFEHITIAEGTARSILNELADAGKIARFTWHGSFYWQSIKSLNSQKR